MSSIDIKNLYVKYIYKRETIEVIKGLNAYFEDGTINVICGYSGSGKTTLLKTIIGFNDYDGEILIDNIDSRSLTIGEKNLAFVSQNYALYPHLTIFDNIANPLKLSKAPREEIIKRVYEVSEILKIKDLLTRKPRHLSGGQQQRVAIAKALIKRPRVYLFDEPLSNLDYSNRLALRQMIKNVVRLYNSTAIYVTHDFNEAMSIADKIFILNDGKIEIEGKPIDIYNSKNEIVESLKQEINEEKLL